MLGPRLQHVAEERDRRLRPWRRPSRPGSSCSAISVSFVLRSTRACRSLPLIRGPPWLGTGPPGRGRPAPRRPRARPGAAGPPPAPTGEYSITLERFTKSSVAQRRGEARGAGRRQHVVGAGHVVADDLGRVGAHEDGARVAHARQQRGGDAHHQLQVLGRQPVGDVDRGVQIGHQHEGAVRGQRLGGDGPAGQPPRAARPAPPPRRGSSSGASVISSARAIGSCSAWASRSAAIQAGSAAPVGDHHDLAGARHHVDADVAEHARLGERDVDVAGPDDLVHAADGGGAVGQRRDRLGAADAPALGHAGHPGRGQHGRPAPAPRRRAASPGRSPARRPRGRAPPSSAPSRDRPRGRRGCRCRPGRAAAPPGPGWSRARR